MATVREVQEKQTEVDRVLDQLRQIAADRRDLTKLNGYERSLLLNRYDDLVKAVNEVYFVLVWASER